MVLPRERTCLLLNIGCVFARVRLEGNWSPDHPWQPGSTPSPHQVPTNRTFSEILRLKSWRGPLHAQRRFCLFSESLITVDKSQWRFAMSCILSSAQNNPVKYATQHFLLPDSLVFFSFKFLKVFALHSSRRCRCRRQHQPCQQQQPQPRDDC